MECLQPWYMIYVWQDTFDCDEVTASQFQYTPSRFHYRVIHRCIPHKKYFFPNWMYHLLFCFDLSASHLFVFFWYSSPLQAVLLLLPPLLVLHAAYSWNYYSFFVIFFEYFFATNLRQLLYSMSPTVLCQSFYAVPPTETFLEARFLAFLKATCFRWSPMLYTKPSLATQVWATFHGTFFC